MHLRSETDLELVAVPHPTNALRPATAQPDGQHRATGRVAPACPGPRIGWTASLVIPFSGRAYRATRWVDAPLVPVAVP